MKTPLWEILVRDPEKIPTAYSEYYRRLARHFAVEIGTRHFNNIVEIGCGIGQLTLPLLKLLPKRVRMIAADSFEKPYSGGLRELERRVEAAGLNKRIRLVETDAANLDPLKSGSVDLIVSNELLCDLVPKAKLKTAIGEFRRVLRPRGVMVHGEWSSTPSNVSDQFRTRHSPSWDPDELQSLMWSFGFREFRVTYFDTTIRFMQSAAVEELRSWGASPRYLSKHERALKRSGVRLPFEHVIRCGKQRGRNEKG